MKEAPLHQPSDPQACQHKRRSCPNSMTGELMIGGADDLDTWWNKPMVRLVSPVVSWGFWGKNSKWHKLNPKGSMGLVYLPTFTIKINQELVYIYHTWILWEWLFSWGYSPGSTISDIWDDPPSSWLPRIWASYFPECLGRSMGIPAWRIIPISKWLVTPIYKPFGPFVRGTTLLRGLTNQGY